MKLHLPYEFNGQPTTPIVNFSIGPMGTERSIAKKKLFEEDPRLELDYLSDSEVLRKRAQGVIKSRLDTIYNIEPGETVDVPANHAAYLKQTFGFLKEESIAPDPFTAPVKAEEPIVATAEATPPAVEATPTATEESITPKDKK